MVSLSLFVSFPPFLLWKKRRSCTFWGDVNEMNKLMVGMFVERSIVLFCFRSKPAVHHRSSNCLTRWNLFPRKTNTILWELYVFFFWIYRCIDWIIFFFFFLKKKKKKLLKTFPLRMTVDSWRDRHRQLLVRPTTLPFFRSSFPPYKKK